MAWKVGHPLKRDGTSQRQRLPHLLRPENVPIDARPTEELLATLYRIAGQFTYYNLNDEVDGTWEEFFPQLFVEGGSLSLENIRSYLTKANRSSNNGPFMTILLAFLHLYQHLQNDINRLSGEHLKFYYEQVLRFRRRPASPDRVHITFELSPRVAQHLLPAGTRLKAGKDKLGYPVNYVLEREIVVNQTRIAELKTVLVEPDGCIYAAKVANSADGLGAALHNSPASWPAFGNPDYMQLSSVGIAVASQLLFLREGLRRIVISLVFESLPEGSDVQELFTRLIPYGSGEERWIELHLDTVDVVGSTVSLTILASPDLPPVIPFERDKLDGNLNTNLPVIKLLLDPQRPPYSGLKGLRLLRYDIEVNVAATPSQTGLQQLVVQSDQGLLNARGSFQPFGHSPSSGSRFYIGSPEAFSKPLDNFTLQIRWADLPDDANGFADYYASYDSTLQGNGSFLVQFEALHNNRWQPFGGRADLFTPASGRLLADRAIEGGRLELSLSTGLPDFERWDVSLPQGFIRLRLNQDFGHRDYPKIFASEAAGAAEFPNPPYTPTIQSISMGYTASQSIPLRQLNEAAQLFYLLPFGSEKISASDDVSFLPSLAQGQLFIGLENFRAPQSLHLLFQALEGSAESVDTILKDDILWHYRGNAGWSPLRGQAIFADTTQGLQQPGVIAFNIGKDASSQSSELPGNFHWLRASINKNPAGAAKLVAIHTQAATAAFADQNNDPDYLRSPLEANRIKALNTNVSAIKKIIQPYESFKGAPVEEDNHFYSRVSERLRHKQRAINTWDYERLVLAEFPEIYKVKTISHTGLDRDKRYTEFLPGHNSVVLVPQSRRQNTVNPLEPKASGALLERVRRYLLPYTSYFVGQKPGRLHVLNPRYEPIRLVFSVGFREGYDGGYYAEVLNTTLRRHLSPWAYDEGADIAFGGKVYKAQLLAFVEKQEYVDYITDFKVFHMEAGPGIGEMCVGIDFIVRSNDPGDEVEVAVASTAASILVSAESHDINILSPGEYPCDDPRTCEGIGCMYINIDFIIGAT